MADVSNINAAKSNTFDFKSKNTTNSECDSDSIFKKVSEKLPIFKSDHKNDDASRIKVLNSRSNTKIIPAKNQSNLSFEEKQKLLKEANSDPMHREQKLKDIEKNIHENKYKEKKTDTTVDTLESNKKIKLASNKQTPLTENEKELANYINSGQAWRDMLK